MDTDFYTRGNTLGSGPRRAAGLALLAGGLMLAGCQEEQASANVEAAAPPPPVVTVAKPVTRKIVEDDAFIGRFAAVNEVEIRSRVGGYLETVEFTDGEIVEAGDLLFTIDARPFQTALNAAQAEVESAVVAVASRAGELATGRPAHSQVVRDAVSEVMSAGAVR